MRTEDVMYLRKSRADKEAEALGEMETLARHKKILSELAKRQNLNVTKIYEEIVSGESIADRPMMTQLLQDVYSKKYRSVLVMEVERLARGDTRDQGEVAEAFKYSNTLIVTPVKTYDPTNQYDEEYFEFGLFMSRREYKTIQRRLQTGKIESVKEGNYIGARAPFGYDIHNRGRGDRTLQRNDQARYVELIFEWFVNERMPAGEIARRLTSMGVPTQTGKSEWHRATIKDMLRNHLYIGKVRWFRRKQVKVYDGERMKKTTHRNLTKDFLIVDGKHDGIVSEELFNKAQELFTGIAPVRRNKLINPFAGILRCPNCGKLMIYKKLKTARDRFNHVESKVCNAKSCFADDIMDGVIAALNETIGDFQIVVDESNSENEVAKYEALKISMVNELKKLEGKRVQLFDLLEDGFYTREEFAERKSLLVGKIDKLKQSLSELRPPDKSAYEAKITKFSEVVESLRDENVDAFHKNILLKEIIKSIDYTNTSGIELDIHFNS